MGIRPATPYPDTPSAERRQSVSARCSNRLTSAAAARSPEPVQLYRLVVQTFVIHHDGEDDGQCPACGQVWPCDEVRQAFRLREGF
jgi:hypothetical protein